jgi:hypothetical protein
MLLPADLRRWVPEDDLVHFVINAVETMRLSALRVNERGSGSKPYPPRMMLIKAAMGMRQFLLRGLEKVRIEWDLACLAYNVRRVWSLSRA